MNARIYYFSGTGNSLYIAKELKRRISGSKLIPMISSLNKDIIEIDADIIGIIFPLQGPTFPNAVKQFLEKIKFPPDSYIFAIATRGGTTSKIHEEINKILKKKNRSLNSHFSITMFNNDPKLLNKDNKIYEFHIPTKEELILKESEISKKLDFIQQKINKKENCHEKDNEYHFKYNFILERIVLFAIKLMESKSIKNYFFADLKCKSCGLCEKVCLSNRIKMVDKKPHWDDKILCHMCYACLNFCPAESIQINSKWYMKSYTTKQGRYPHPYATVKDMEEQKIL
jgi:ferredoxin